MRYRYATWCRYCIGDDEGAICDTSREHSDDAFDTIEEAQQAAKDYCSGYNHLDYHVIDEHYKDVQERQAEGEEGPFFRDEDEEGVMEDLCLDCEEPLCVHCGQCETQGCEAEECDCPY